MSVDSNNTPIDPRVQIELEKLNAATDNINKFEVELDEIKCEFKRTLAESEIRIKQAAHKLGNSIDAAKPYYESRIYATQLAKETQKAAANYEKAKSIHAAAKEMVSIAEQGLGEKSTLDTACQEMLSHAASKVNQSQLEMTDAHNSLKMCQLKLDVTNNRVSKLQSQLKQAIKSSRPFYETRANYNGILKAQKAKINELENKIAEAKIAYNEALKNLESISEEIHQRRQERKKLQHSNHKWQQDSDRVSNDSFEMENFQKFYRNETSLEGISKLSTNFQTALEQTQQNEDSNESTNLLENFQSSVTLDKTVPINISQKSSVAKATFAGNLFETMKIKEHDSKCSSTSKDSNPTKDCHDEELEQWTEIRLSHSESTSSSYSNQSLLHEHPVAILEDHSSTSSDEPKYKVTCTTIFQEDSFTKKQTLSQWLARSNGLKANSRRQSLDLLIDAGDKVKDVFSIGFQKVGRTLERRNSESEMNTESSKSSSNSIRSFGQSNSSTSTTTTTTATDFFSFPRFETKDLLTDEQVENLLINHALDENGIIIVEELQIPLLKSTNKFALPSILV